MKTENPKDVKKIVINSLGILFCVILLPILVLNCILIVNGIVHPDKVPSVGNKTPMIVLTDSMYPEIKSGDLIICEKVEAGDIKVGDVISFFDPSGRSESVTTHRVNSIENNPITGIKFYTQGDNNNIEDGFPVPAENLVGRWTGVRIWGLGSVILFTQSPLGIILCIVLPVGVIVLLYFVNKKKQDAKQLDDYESLKRELEELKKDKEEKNNN